MSVRVTLDTEFFCRCYAVQPQDFSCCRIRVTLDTVYHCWCYACIRRNDYEVVKSAVPLLTNCTLWQAMQICTRVQQLCIRLNSSKIHTSNNNLAACAAPFIPPHSSQLRILCTYQLPQPCMQYPLSFEYFTCCTLSPRVFLPSQQ